MKRHKIRFGSAAIFFVLATVLVLSQIQGLAWAQKRGGTLVIGLEADPGHFNLIVKPGTTVQVPAVNIYNKLITLDFNLNPKPELAKSWEIKDGGKKIIFHLRRGVKFHDGKEMTSEDVKFTLEKALPYNPRSRVFWKPVAERVEAPDKYTVVVYLKKPFAPLLTVMGVIFGGPAIYPKHLWKNYVGTRKEFLNAPWSKKPVGTGPFIFKEYKKGSHVTLVRNPNYWNAPKPYADKLVIRFISDANTRLIALEKGEIDYLRAALVPWDQVSRLRKNPKLVVFDRGGEATGQVEFMLLNLRRPITGNVKVRQAIAYALDKNQITQLVSGGTAKVANGIMHSAMKWAHKAGFEQYKQDLAMANRLLDEAGYPMEGGKRFGLTLTWARGRSFEGVAAEVIKQQLKKVGIDIKIESFDRAATLQKVYINHDFDIMMQFFTTGPDPKISVTRVYDRNNIGAANFNNAPSYINVGVQQLLDAEWQIQDRKKRGAMWRQIADMVAADAPVIPLFETPFVHTYSRKWADVVTRPYCAYCTREDAHLR